MKKTDIQKLKFIRNNSNYLKVFARAKKAASEGKGKITITKKDPLLDCQTLDTLLSEGFLLKTIDYHSYEALEISGW